MDNSENPRIANAADTANSVTRDLLGSLWQYYPESDKPNYDCEELIWDCSFEWINQLMRQDVFNILRRKIRSEYRSDALAGNIPLTEDRLMEVLEKGSVIIRTDDQPSPQEVLDRLFGDGSKQSREPFTFRILYNRVYNMIVHAKSVKDAGVWRNFAKRHCAYENWVLPSLNGETIETDEGRWVFYTNGYREDGCLPQKTLRDGFSVQLLESWKLKNPCATRDGIHSERS